MKIAIVGGGAAGMATAYYLNKQHEVTLFEKQPILGGNIRTLNKNVTNIKLDKHLILDNGVVEFQTEYFVNFVKLLRELKVKVAGINPVSNLFLANGRAFQSLTSLIITREPLWNRIRFFIRLFRLLPEYLRFRQMDFTSAKFHHQPVSYYFTDSVYGKWMKMILMYAYSISYEAINNFPLEIAIPVLKHSSARVRWFRINGGVYTYVDKIVSQFKGRIFCNASINHIHRDKNGVYLSLSSGEIFTFDKLVFACTPDQILKMLADPTDEERRRFGAWQGNEIQTIIHTDESMYRRYGGYFGEFDLFEGEQPGEFGYNAYLNRLCDIHPPNHLHYHLAYNLNHRLDSAKIIHVQNHSTPLYSVEAIRYRHEVIDTNGQNHTYHAGAYLGDGLHEGAISSAVNVCALIRDIT